VEAHDDIRIYLKGTETHLARAYIAAGREALASPRASREHAEARTVPGSRIARLLALLWHPEADIRKAAALALAGGNRESRYVPQYGHFASAFLSYLTSHAPHAPASPAERYAAVVHALRVLLDRNASDIRAMGNMSYSFLGSALYLALLYTCRDVIEAVRRLRVSAAHTELCRLLWHLSHVNLTRRLNSEDWVTLVQTACAAFAALPPDEIPDFWHSLMHRSLPRRLAVAPVLSHLRDDCAVPYLLHALREQPPCIAQPIIECLGRLGDPRALALLQCIVEGRDRLLRNHARLAIAAIGRAHANGPARTLLRPLETNPDADPASLLRPAHPTGAMEPPEEMLRVPDPPSDPAGEEP